MHRFFLIVGLLGFLGVGSTVGAAERFELKVLYAGDPKSGRAAEFRSFLEEHFAKVAVADFLTLAEPDARGFDVVILDWPELPPRDENGFKRPRLGADYGRPTILIGGGPLAVTRDQDLKLRDMCVCLGDAAHDIAAGHEIFHKPYEVRLSYEDRPVPSYYRSWPEGDRLGTSMKVWKVQTRGWSIEKPDEFSILPGMVADPYGFTDSPDAESIASGINTKSPAAVAIGRHGNFLLWGFYGSPSVLTPEARRCFINSICYISKFDGQRPLVRKPAGRQAREWALVYAYSYRQLTRESPEPERPGQGVGNSAESHRQRVEDYRQIFPAGLRERLGTDPARYVEYYQAKLEFLRPSDQKPFPFVVDEDVEALGLSNRKVELLDTCIAMLDDNNRAALARRILKRYTTEDYPDAEGWRSWLARNRDRLFFSDIGGFKFLLAPEPRKSSAASREDGATLDPKEPIEAAAELSPARARSGDTLALVVRVKVAPTWHIYAVGASRGPNSPATLNLTLPAGIEAEGDWICPAAARSADGQMIYEGPNLEFRRRLRIAEGATGPIELSCELGYQACDRSSCRPPTKRHLRARGEIVPLASGEPRP